MVSVLCTSAVALATLLVSSVSAAPRVDSSVHRTLRQQGTVNLIVTFKQGTAAVLESVHEADYATRGDKIKALVASLEVYAQASQAELTKILTEEPASFESSTLFWISNQRYFKGAALVLVERLAGLASVSEIREEIVLPLTTATPPSSNTTEAQPLANEYGVSKVQADQVWAYGYTGQGVVVGSIGTGVLGTHDALKGNWRSSYGWYDPNTKTAIPTDGNGLGTHTMGTIAGVGGIGVAPGASWIACRGCTATSCSESDLLTCAQWVTCPTDTTGKNKDCTKAPQVVSNSWGGGQGDSFYKAAVDAWRAAGIIPIFEAGNGGPTCSTANSPGDYANVIAVGATDAADALAAFSSKGPSMGGLLKPEVTAPGVGVRSAWNTADSSYSSLSGVSMAAPHVTGVVVLLLSAKRGLKYAEVKSLLTSTTDTVTLKASGYNCGTSKDGVFPNNMYGYGRVNALAAFQKATGAVVTPTTRPPIPVPTPAPTTKTPIPVPTPTPTTPAPTTLRPTPPPATWRPTPRPTRNYCTGLGSLECFLTDGCRFDYNTDRCVREF